MLYPHPYVLNPVPVPKRRQSLRLWLNPDDASTHETSGGLVERIFDASGHGNHAVKALDSERPTIGLLNGRKILVFNTDDKMTGTTLLTGDQDFTVFAVVRKVTAPSSGNAYFTIGTDISYGLSVGASPNLFPGVLNGGIAWHSEPGGLADGSVVRQTMRRDEAIDTLYYTRGDLVSLSWVNNPGPTPYGVYTLGRHGASTQSVDICELIFCFENMHESYRSEINKYLNDRWGTT